MSTSGDERVFKEGDVLYGAAYQDYDAWGEAPVLFTDPAEADKHVAEQNLFDSDERWQRTEYRVVDAAPALVVSYTRSFSRYKRAELPDSQGKFDVPSWSYDGELLEPESAQTHKMETGDMIIISATGSDLAEVETALDARVIEEGLVTP